MNLPDSANRAIIRDRSAYIFKKFSQLLLFPIFLLIPISSLCFSQVPASIQRADSNTTELKRSLFKVHLQEDIIKSAFLQPLSNKSEDKWMGAFWAAKFSYCKDVLVLNSLKKAIDQYDQRSLEFNRSTLEIIYTLFPDQFNTEMEKILHNTSDAKHFSISALYLCRQRKNDKLFTDELNELIKTKFPDCDNNPVLIMLKVYINSQNYAAPPLSDLLAHNFGDSVTIIYSFHRKNRDYEGLTVIRNSDGRFLSDSSGNIICIPQLARALSNLPGFLTNGNTPSGIFSIINIDTSDNIFIGKTPFIVTALPYEVSPETYFKDSSLKDIEWSSELYRKLLPASWQDYNPIYEAYFAGKAGRSEIVMHGTTIDPEFYKGSPYYPNTPSLGCLTAMELYSPSDGKLIHSNQQKLIDLFLKCKSQKGYLIVIELDNKQQPVELSEVLPQLLKSEK